MFTNCLAIKLKKVLEKRMPHQYLQLIGQAMVPYLLHPVKSGIYKMYLQVWISGQMIQQVGITLPPKIQEIPVIAKVGHFELFVPILFYFKESIDRNSCTETSFNFTSSQESVKVNI